MWMTSGDLLAVDSPRAVGFPADFVGALLQEAQVLPVHGHGLCSGKTRPWERWTRLGLEITMPGR